MFFDFLKREKEYTSCEWFKYGIHMATNGLYHCDKYSHEGGNNEPVSYLRRNLTYDFDDFFRKKQKAQIGQGCKGCLFLKKKKWDNSRQIKYMAISANTTCNSNCIYCNSFMYKKMFNSRPDIPVLEFIKKMVKSKRLRPDSEIQIGGGEPVLHREFEDIMNLFIANKFNDIHIYSSGIKYSPSIEKGLKAAAVKELVISPDAGNKELYKKIKNVNKFDEVWQNISDYCKAQKNNSVMVKYMLLPSINDNDEAIKEFFDKVLESKALHVSIDLERNWYNTNKNDKQKIHNVLTLVKKMEKYAIEAGLTFNHFPSVCYAVNDNREMYDAL